MTDRRLLLVHAHPDDETIGNGATMAKYVAEGAAVTLVTCTLGELGEVLVPDLEHLAAHRDDGLGQHRIGELDKAMEILGVTDHRFLGGAGRYRDSGMIYADDGSATVPPDVSDDSFWRADLLEASTHLVEVIREVRPQVLVTYDDFGGYGHPDHVQAHRVAHYASSLAAVSSFRSELGEAWDIPKIYWSAMSASRMRAGLRALRDAGDTTTFEGMDPDALPPMAVEDADLSAEIDGAAYVDKKLDAMRAHATQIAADSPFFALSGSFGNQIWATEHYRLARGVSSAADGELESDLFGGVAGH
ncbi:N-acetyl-1-D-myo-inositol-2-amino-2-deoxy-alpha-D-glucopyranoside deacetylase [Solicola gregarius]|uniref:1D-myo-inositol 2-acetamido-2-deoxy-alpha-D-glucopyranoside deacetylase n=1 Tax=Solicola gregarius TaxID=2908642 RepID=A0AA46YM58_9ACTN|nr:N-acetyl-1-D-myo-inositol-2-amino-2-deoxy-alpha-D-glucopyranoside deacetylase [Solicola gregarius]UYM06206.1 N-acetyl-1-D-myo-inositol-2-amino-2-deoxy-alpha-D-glucopyranoside deacetylase [Solicola gregarius]